jgi:hypothetical protein
MGIGGDPSVSQRVRFEFQRKLINIGDRVRTASRNIAKNGKE